MPVKAGIHDWHLVRAAQSWMPAFAGMTGMTLGCITGGSAQRRGGCQPLNLFSGTAVRPCRISGTRSGDTPGNTACRTLGMRPDR